MDAAAPKTLDNHSHVVRPAKMEWKKTRFPGCEVKGLLLDQQTGLVTALMRLGPGAVLPDHEHVKIEQTYVLEGKLVDKEGPVAGLSVGAGEFVWREAGTRHVAWTPEGGLILAMFQVPNKILRARRPRHRYIAPTGTASGATYLKIKTGAALRGTAADSGSEIITVPPAFRCVPKALAERTTGAS
jgi:quercetin dioxygenase-like cupin family protein